MQCASNDITKVEHLVGYVAIFKYDISSDMYIS